MTTREGVRRILQALDTALADLTRHAAMVPLQRLETDRDAYLAVYAALYQAAQSAIDLGEVLVRTRTHASTDTYGDVFRALGAEGLVPQPLARQLEDWASFRNVLAHVYTKLDLERVHRAYTEELEPLRELRRIAAALLGD